MAGLGLCSRRDPVVDEEHPVAGFEKGPAHSEVEVAILVVGAGDGLPPRVAVRGSFRVLSHLGEADAKVLRSEDPYQAASGFGPHDDGRKSVREEPCETGAQFVECVCIAPPSRDIGPRNGVGSITSPRERMLESLNDRGLGMHTPMMPVRCA